VVPRNDMVSVSPLIRLPVPPLKSAGLRVYVKSIVPAYALCINRVHIVRETRMKFRSL